MNVARAAKETLERDGWIQGRYHDTEGRHCLLGAISMSCVELKDFGFIQKIIRDILLEQYPGYTYDYFDSIIGWNDHEGRTIDEVIAVLEKAAVRMDEAI